MNEDDYYKKLRERRGPGPWDEEPDHCAWTTRSGLEAHARRVSLGFWCGYVTVAAGHPAHGMTMDQLDLVVHGGVTWSKPAGDEWEVGFDCGHAGDRMPGVPGLDHGTYRTLPYVKNQCELLADQLVAMLQELN